MPSYGETQKTAGVKLKTPDRLNRVEKRSMLSRNMDIETSLTIDNIPYKGNANLLANR